MINREAPHNFEAERAVLGALMIGRQAMDKVVGWLVPADFYLDKHAAVYRACVTLHEAGTPLDLQTLDAAIVAQGSRIHDAVGGIPFLAELEGDVPTAANVEYYGHIVKAAGTRRAVIMAGTKIVEMGFSERITDEELLDRADALMFATTEGRSTQELLPLRKAMIPLWERLHNPSGLHGIATGFYDLDQLMGGLQPQNLTILAARPGQGKTSWALNVAEHVATAQQTPVAFFSMEMSSEELGMRLACSRAGVGMQLVRSGLISDQQLGRLTRAHGQLSEVPIWIDETPALSPTELRAKARRAKLAHGIGLIVVDYLQLMEPRTQESRERGVAEVSRALKNLAKELNVPVLACAQLNREAERRADHRPQLSDLRDSGALEMDADSVLFIYRPKLYGENVLEDVAEIIVGKNRNGPTGTIRLRFAADQTRFLNRLEVASNGHRVP